MYVKLIIWDHNIIIDLTKMYIIFCCYVNIDITTVISYKLCLSI